MRLLLSVRILHKEAQQLQHILQFFVQPGNPVLQGSFGKGLQLFPVQDDYGNASPVILKNVL
jgi:hypothetical protein